MPATVALTDSFTSTTGAASFSKSCAIGTAASDRVIAVVVIGQNSANGATYTCTIGGNAATQKVYRANNRSAVGIFFLAVPSGTTATVDVASSTNFDNCHFSVHRLTGIDASTGVTGSQVGTSTAASMAVTVNPATAGIALAGVRASRASHRASVASAIVATGSQTITATISGTDSAVTWTGLTEDSETVVAAAGSSVQSMAVAVWYEAATTGITVDNAAHTHTATEPALVAKNAVAPANSAHSHTATSSALTATSTITPDEASHGVTSTSPVLSVSASIAVNSSSHDHSAASPTITVRYTIASGDTAHSHTATSPSLFVGGIVGPSYPLITIPAERKRVTWPAEKKRTTYRAERKRVTFPAWPNGVNKMIILETKGAAEILTIRVPITNWPMVSTDNPVVDYTVSVTSGNIVATKLEPESDGTLRFTMSGGTAGSSASILLLASLADGQKPDQTFNVFVR